MKKFLIFISLFLLLVFQTTAGQYIRIFNIIPNFMLTFAVVYSVSNIHIRSAIVGLLCGVMLDLATVHNVFGVSSLLIMYICLGVSSLSCKFYYESTVVTVIFVFLVTVIYEFIYLFVTDGFFGNAGMIYAFWRYIIPEAIFNSIICFPLRLWVRWLKNEYIRGI